MQLDERFENLVKGLMATDKKIAEAMREQAKPRPWCNLTDDEIPSDQRPTSKKETELAGSGKILNRDDVNQEYVEKRADKEAKAKDVVVPKIEGDFMAAFERDKRMQWRSRIRTMAHAAARRAGNGADTGPLRKNTTDYLTRVYMKSKERPVTEAS